MTAAYVVLEVEAAPASRLVLTGGSRHVVWLTKPNNAQPLDRRYCKYFGSCQSIERKGVNVRIKESPQHSKNNALSERFFR